MRALEVDLIAFDWSGTISDDRIPVYRANVSLHKEFGIPIPDFEEWLKTIRMTVDDAMIEKGVQLDRNTIRKKYEQSFNAVTASGILPTIYPDALAVLSHLISRGKRLAVLSSHPDKNLILECRRYRLDGFFSFMQGNSRDKALGIREILWSLDVRQERAMYVGDTIHDVAAAKAAGVHSVAVCTGYHPKEKLQSASPTWLIDNLLALRNETIK